MLITTNKFLKPTASPKAKVQLQSNRSRGNKTQSPRSQSWLPIQRAIIKSLSAIPLTNEHYCLWFTCLQNRRRMRPARLRVSTSRRGQHLSKFSMSGLFRNPDKFVRSSIRSPFWRKTWTPRQTSCIASTWSKDRQTLHAKRPSRTLTVWTHSKHPKYNPDLSSGQAPTSFESSP